MRGWQASFFRPSGQVLFWALVALAGWLLVNAGSGRARWWPFQPARPAIVVAPADPSTPSSGWTPVAKAAMPAVVAQDIQVTLADRRELAARLVGADPQTDLAVLKLAGSSFPLVAFGDSNL